MKIAIILPSLAHTGPILVAKAIVDFIYDKVEKVHVYYFDTIQEVTFSCQTFKINFHDRIPFEDYDVIHSHMYRPDKYLSKYASTIDAKTITTVHCDISQDLKYNYNVFIVLFLKYVWLGYFKKMDKVVIISNSLYESFYAKKLDNNKVKVIYNGRTFGESQLIPDSQMKLLRNLKQSYKIIGACALLTKRKGLDMIIKSLPYLPDYVFVIVGDGKEMYNLKKLATNLNVTDRCFFLGFQKSAEAYLPYFDIYAMPSLYEGFGLALIEATLAKVSCVCSSIPIFKELFSVNEVTYFDTNDIKSLVEAIEIAYQSRFIKVENAYKKSIEAYSVEKMGKKYLETYNELIN